jgi:hypothetical protein
VKNKKQIPKVSSYLAGEGIFIINEGLFNQANSSVYFYHFGKDSMYPIFSDSEQ